MNGKIIKSVEINGDEDNCFELGKTVKKIQLDGDWFWGTDEYGKSLFAVAKQYVTVVTFVE